MRKLLNSQGKPVTVGEVFYDRAGNECYYRENGTLSVTSVNKSASRTIQSERDKVDIHKILDKFSRTGIMGNVRSSAPVYGDFSSAVDYMESQSIIARANESFLSLPSELRKRFGNDPVKLLSFLDDVSNRAEAVKLGLIDDISSQSSPQASQVPQGEAGEDTPK